VQGVPAGEGVALDERLTLLSDDAGGLAPASTRCEEPEDPHELHDV